ncbi:protein-S-isoprenylcysteine O-methyltransferase Ste14 [Paraburkholderia tropica]|uniref:methyltransferase family protein n=1 Tax=Paraburkholderia tropica TaxID=92647 RepID=UPI00160860F3|nr:isoprenylcysteine carboxylmethyltransferase family protein [Paraburkholderia tropica]MBB3004576.1 protein-S-isoprenylcysteine O-methyltransferase Ste14 [Paraburkholderia tropica]MBB6323643.1 protein-S-isoprenylcysteine O-methyltransferase Ste14 [Paraburkholderia tropica]
MNIAQSIAIVVPWLAWLAYWIATAQAVKTTARREARSARTWQSLPLIAGGALLILPDPTLNALSPDPTRLGAMQFGGFAVLVAGLLFSVWARVHLGTNWSVSVTLKEGHELIRTGPYALVRHPIYTGCLIALAGSALIGETWRGAAGLVLIFASLAFKVRIEESWLTGHFGDAYARYRREVAALIPGIY